MYVNIADHSPRVLSQTLVSNGFVVLTNWQTLIEQGGTDILQDELILDTNNDSPFRLHIGSNDGKHKYKELLLLNGDESSCVPLKLLAESMQNISLTLTSMVAKSFDLSYSFFNQYMSNHDHYMTASNGHTRQRNHYNDWNFIAVTKACKGSCITCITEKDPIVINEPCLILSVGKMLEIVSKGLLFSNILEITAPEGSKFSSTVISYSSLLNLDLSIHETMESIYPNFNRLNYDKQIQQRISKVNNLRDRTSANPNQYKNRNYNTTSLSKGQEFIVGYVNNHIDYLEIKDSDLQYACFDINLDPYLSVYDPNETIGNILAYSFVSHQKLEKLSEPLREKKKVVEKGLLKFKVFQDEKVQSNLKFLVKIFANLDNIVYIYFMSHSNLPSLTKQFIPNLTKILGKDVLLLDILKIKFLYPESFEIFKVQNSNDLLIGLAQSEMENFAKKLSERKVKFAQKVDDFIERHKLQMNVILKYANEVYENLPIVDNVKNIQPSNEAFINSSSQEKTTNLKASLAKPQKSLNKIVKNTNRAKSTITALQTDVANQNSGKKLSLLDRIKLKEAQAKKQKEFNAQQNNNGSGKSTEKITDELLMVFEILYNLNTTSSAKSLTARQVTRKIVDSFTSRANIISMQLAFELLKIMNTKLPNEYYQLLEFKDRASNANDLLSKKMNMAPTDNNGSMKIIKFNFFNRREEIVKLLRHND